MSPVDAKFYEKKKGGLFLMSVIFFIFSILLTGGLYFYNMQISGSSTELETQIAELSASIRNIEKNENVQIYSTYSKHKNVLEELAYRSNIPLFISHLKKYTARNGLIAEGFSYMDGKVEVGISSQTNENGFAYQKVVKFLRAYRQDEKALFDADLIQDVTGYDTIKYSGEFTLK